MDRPWDRAIICRLHPEDLSIKLSSCTALRAAQISLDAVTSHPDQFLPKAPAGEYWMTHRAPLKSNALRTLIPTYSEWGFATCPTKVQKDSLVVRIAWVYPDARLATPYCSYETVGFIAIPRVQDPFSAEWKWHPFSSSPMRSILARFFQVENPKLIFSDDGMAEIKTVFDSIQNGGHARTKLTALRIKIVQEHTELWNDPKKIVMLLREQGLLSLKCPLAQHVSAVEAIIYKIKRSANDELRSRLNWRNIVGNFLADHTWPQGVQNGVLTIETQRQSLAESIQAQYAEEIIQRLNKALGDMKVTGLLIVVRPFSG